MIPATTYEFVHRRLLHEYKFNLNRQSVYPMSQLVTEAVQNIGPTPFDFITIVPTSQSRVRSRGFDHAKLLAKEISKQLELKFHPTASRRTNNRQLGASRSKRILQMQSEFVLLGNMNLSGANVLLVDDMMTTGSSLSAMSKLLKSAGVKRVTAAIFTQKTG